MKNRTLLLTLSLISSLGLFSCNNNQETEQGGDGDGGGGTPVLTEEDKLFEALTTLKNNPDYTLDISDSTTHFVQYFNANCWTYDFDDSYKYVSYIEDETGIFQVSISKDDSSYKLDYYEVNEYGENIKNLYENVTYSFSDLTLNKNNYSFDENTNRLYVKDVTSEEGLVLFCLLGYDPSSSYGDSINDVESMYFEFKNNILNFNVIFDSETSSYGTANCIISNIGDTIQPSSVKTLLDANIKGYERVQSDDVLFEYLANLKNLRNFTSEVKSDYKNSYSNYTLVSYYMKNAYYSVSSRPSEGDLGYYQDENGIVTLLVDGVTGKTIIGENYLEDQYGNPLKDLYEDAVYSFASTTWNYTFKARVKDNSTYVIDDNDYIGEVANMTDAYTLRLSFTNVELSYDAVNNEYNFKFNMIDDETIYMRIYNIGTTVIGDLPIE